MDGGVRVGVAVRVREGMEGWARRFLRARVRVRVRWVGEERSRRPVGRGRGRGRGRQARKERGIDSHQREELMRHDTTRYQTIISHSSLISNHNLNLNLNVNPNRKSDHRVSYFSLPF